MPDQPLTVAIASDHAAVALKRSLITPGAALAVIFHAFRRHPLPCPGIGHGRRQNGLVGGAVLAHHIGHDALALHVDAGGRALDHLDPLHTGRRNALQDALQIVILGGGPRPIHQHIARGAGEPAHRGAGARIEGKARQTGHHVIGRGGPGVGEEAGRIDRDSLLRLGQRRAYQEPSR